MPLLFLWQAYSWFGTAKALLLPILAKVPWQVWAAIGGVIAVLYYGHIRENRGYAKCEARVEEATHKEQARQDQVASDALNAARARELQATQKAQEASNELDKLQVEVSKLKNAGTTCLPSSITRQYRNR